MSYGKYSPSYNPSSAFIYNAHREIAPDYNGGEYDEKIYSGSYDSNGFDSYGYSAWLADGTYAGIGEGVDAEGLTEFEHLARYNDEVMREDMARARYQDGD